MRVIERNPTLCALELESKSENVKGNNRRFLNDLKAPTNTMPNEQIQTILFFYF